MKERKTQGRLGAIINQYGIYLMFLALMVVASLIHENFLTYKNLASVMRQISVNGVLAFGMTILIISGGVDLSMGSVAAFGGMVGINAYLATNNYLMAFVASCAISIIFGYLSGILVTKFLMPNFIATMAMDTIARGSVYIYTDGSPIYQIGDLGLVSSTLVGPIPLPVIFMLAVGLITFCILKFTRLGRSFYAVGGNREAAAASGINVGRTRRIAFVISGFFVGIAGVLQMARLNSGLPDTAMNYHGDAIASAVIGGTSFTGGVGNAVGTLVGAMIIGIISNILNLAGVQSYVQQVVKGLIIIVAVAFDLMGKARKIKKIRAEEPAKKDEAKAK